MQQNKNIQKSTLLKPIWKLTKEVESEFYCEGEGNADRSQRFQKLNINEIEQVSIQLNVDK